MDLTEYLRELERIKVNFIPTEQDPSCLPVCTQFYEAFLKCVVANVKKNAIESSLSALIGTLQLYSELRPRLASVDLTWDQLGHVIFIESSRVVLGLDFQRLDDVDPAGVKATFKQIVSQTHNILQQYPTGEYFLVLGWLAVNGWTNPILQGMMKGDEVDEENVMTYLRTGEYTELFRLRVDMLMDNGCDDFALNLATWCSKSPLFKADPYIRQAQLLLLIKMDRLEEFHNTCWQIWQFQCCLSRGILQSILAKGRDEEKRPLLTLAQTFLVHDWMKPDKYCCTEPLLQLWLSLQREQEPSADDFIQSVSKMDQLANQPRQLQILMRSLQAQFGREFLQFCMECVLKALRMDRHNLDTARIYMKDDGEADKAADSLAKTCVIIAMLFEGNRDMELASKMTAFYLDPSEEMYHEIKDMVQRNPPPVSEDGTPPSIPAPPDVDSSTYFELLETVNTLRPKTYNTRAMWADLQKHLRSSLEDAGYIYNHRKDCFMAFEEKIPKNVKSRAKEKVRKKVLAAMQEKQLERQDPGSGKMANLDPKDNKPVETKDSSELQTKMNELILQDMSYKTEPQKETDKTEQKAEERPPMVIPPPMELPSQNSEPKLPVASPSAHPAAVTVDNTVPNPPEQPDLLSADSSQMPLLDITLDEIQQVLENSTEPKDTPVSKEAPAIEDTVTEPVLSQPENKETSEDFVLNSIKEFLKEGDVEMQGPSPVNLPPSDDVKPEASGSQGQNAGENTDINPELAPAFASGTLDNPGTSSSEQEDQNMYKCKFCGKAYSTMRQRRRHQEWLCRFKINAAAGEKDITKEKCKEIPIVKDSKGYYVCTLCQSTFATLKALRSHERRTHDLHIKGGKVQVPSGLSLKACSVKLDRLEDAPSAKITKPRDTSPIKEKGKEGISKLIKKKYSSNFFKASNKKSDESNSVKNPDLQSKNQMKKAKKKPSLKKLDFFRLTSEEESSETDVDFELVSTFEFDSETGDAEIQTFTPSDKSQAVLCDYCGSVCFSYEEMNAHQRTCQLTPKKTPSKTNMGQKPPANSAITALFADNQEYRHSDAIPEDKVSLLPMLQNADATFQNLLHAIPQSSYHVPIPTQGNHSKQKGIMQQTLSLASESNNSLHAPSQYSAMMKQGLNMQSPKSKINTDQSQQNQITGSKKPSTTNTAKKSKPKPKSQKKPADEQTKSPLSKPIEQMSKSSPISVAAPMKKLIPLSYRICLTCGTEFQNASNCFEHQADMSHFGKGVGLLSKFKCPICNEVFNSAQEGELHMKKHYPKKAQKPKSNDGKSKSPKTNQAENASSKSPLKKPKSSSSGKSKSSSISKGIEVFNSLLSYCDFCHKGFLSQTSLQQHQHAGCEAQPIPDVASGSLVVVEQTVPLYSNTFQMQANNDVVIPEQILPNAVLQGASNTFVSQTVPSHVTTQIPMNSSQISSNSVAVPTLRQEAGIQVNIDEVPFVGAADLPLKESTEVDQPSLTGNSRLTPEGDVQVERITYKNVAMLQHKIWLCSHCSMEFALQKDVVQHWDNTTCKTEFSAYVMDTANFQCIYCGEMFSEAKDCRDHQLASCLKDAGMKVQQLKNKHFHCKMCNGRYYEKCHVERHLIYYHKIEKTEAPKKVQEWFPDSFVQSIHDLLSAKKEAKARSRSPEKKDGGEKSPRSEPDKNIMKKPDKTVKSPKASNNQTSTKKKPKKPDMETTPEEMHTESLVSSNEILERTQPYEVQKPLPLKSTSVTIDGVTPISDNEQTMPIDIGMPTPAPIDIRMPIPTPIDIRMPTPAPIDTRMPTPAPIQTKTPTPAPIDTRTPTPTPIDTRSPTPAPIDTRTPTPAPIDTRTPTPNSKVNIAEPIPSSSLTNHALLEVVCRSHDLPNSIPTSNIAALQKGCGSPKVTCSSPVPGCNNSWSSTPTPMSDTSPASTPSSRKSRASKSSKSKTRTDRSSSVESQQSSKSPKRPGKRFQAAPPEHHPCPQCGKIIEDRIALKFHLDWTCSKNEKTSTPSQTPTKKTPEKTRTKNRSISPGSSSFSFSQDSRDSRSIVSDEGSISSTSRVNTPSHSMADFQSDAQTNSNMEVPSCHFCGTNFTNSIELERHVLMMHPQVINFVRCPKCGTLCDGLRGLKAHFCIQKLPEKDYIEALPEDLTMGSRQTSSDHIDESIAMVEQMVNTNLEAMTCEGSLSELEKSITDLPSDIDLPLDTTEKNPPGTFEPCSIPDGFEKTIMTALQDISPSIGTTFQEGLLMHKFDGPKQEFDMDYAMETAVANESSVPTLSEKQADKSDEATTLKPDLPPPDIHATIETYENNPIDSTEPEAPESLGDQTELSPDFNLTQTAVKSEPDFHHSTHDGQVLLDFSELDAVNLKEEDNSHDTVNIIPETEPEDLLPQEEKPRSTEESSYHDNPTNCESVNKPETAINCESVNNPETTINCESVNNRETTVVEYSNTVVHGDIIETEVNHRDEIGDVVSETDLSQVQTLATSPEKVDEIEMDRTFTDVGSEDHDSSHMTHVTDQLHGASGTEDSNTATCVQTVTGDPSYKIEEMNDDHPQAQEKLQLFIDFGGLVPDVVNTDDDVVCKIKEEVDTSDAPVETADCGSDTTENANDHVDTIPDDVPLAKVDISEAADNITTSVHSEFTDEVDQTFSISDHDNDTDTHNPQSEVVQSEIKSENDILEDGSHINKLHPSVSDVDGIYPGENIEQKIDDSSPSGNVLYETPNSPVWEPKNQMRDIDMPDNSNPLTEICPVPNEKATVLSVENQTVPFTIDKSNGIPSCDDMQMPVEQTENELSSVVSESEVAPAVDCKLETSDISTTNLNDPESNLPGVSAEILDTSNKSVHEISSAGVGKSSRVTKHMIRQNSTTRQLKYKKKPDNTQLMTDGKLTEGSPDICGLKQDVTHSNMHSENDASDASGMLTNVPENEPTNIEEPNTSEPCVDFHSTVVAKALKAWSKPKVGVKKVITQTPKLMSKKSVINKANSFDLLLCRKQKNNLSGYLEKMKKVCAKQRDTRPRTHITVGKKDKMATKKPLDTIEIKRECDEIKTEPSPDLSPVIFPDYQKEITPKTDLAIKKEPSTKKAAHILEGKTPFSVKWKTFGQKPLEGTISIPVAANPVQDDEKPVNCDAAENVDFSEYHKKLQEIVQDTNSEIISEFSNDSAKHVLPCGDVLSNSDIDISDSSTSSPYHGNEMSVHQHCSTVKQETANDDGSALTSELQKECGSRYECPFCDEERSFVQECSLSSHLKWVHGVSKENPTDEKDELSCPICKDLPSFSEAVMLIYHMRAVHNIANFDVGNITSRQKHGDLAKNIDMIDSSSAKTCLKGNVGDAELVDDTGSVSSISGHSNITGIETGVCLDGGNFGNSHPDLAARVLDPRRTCAVCNIGFLKKKHFRMHMSRFHKTKDYSAVEYTKLKHKWNCAVCNTSFSRHNDWKKHMLTHTNSQKKVLTLEDCNILRRATLYHRESIHSYEPVKKTENTDKYAQDQCFKPTLNVQASSDKWDGLFNKSKRIMSPVTYSKKGQTKATSSVIIMKTTPLSSTMSQKESSRCRSPSDVQSSIVISCKAAQQSEVKTPASSDDKFVDKAGVSSTVVSSTDKFLTSSIQKDNTEQVEMTNILSLSDSEQGSGKKDVVETIQRTLSPRLIKKRKCSCECMENGSCADLTKSNADVPHQVLNDEKRPHAKGKHFAKREKTKCNDPCGGPRKKYNKVDMSKEKSISKGGKPGKWCVWEHFLRSTLKKQTSVSMKRQMTRRDPPNISSKTESPVTMVTTTPLTRGSIRRQSVSPSKSTGTTHSKPKDPDADTNTDDTPDIENVKERTPRGLSSERQLGPKVVPEEVKAESTDSYRSGRRRRSSSISSSVATSISTSRRQSTDSISSISTIGNKQSTSSDSRSASPTLRKRKKTELAGAQNSSDASKQLDQNKTENLNKGPVRTRMGTHEVCKGMALHTRSAQYSTTTRRTQLRQAVSRTHRHKHRKM